LTGGVSNEILLLAYSEKVLAPHIL